MVANLIFFYYALIGTVVIAAFTGYLRGFKRAALRLVCLAVIALISYPIADRLSYPLSATALNRLMKKAGSTLSEIASANPDLLLTIRSVISAILIPILTAAIFLLFQLLSLIFFDRFSAKLAPFAAKRNERISEKSSKKLGAWIGAASGILIIFVLLTPVSFASSVLTRTPTESLEAIDSGYFSKAEAVAVRSQDGALKKQDAPQNSIKLKMLRNGIAIFANMSQDYEIPGFEESVQTELSNLLTTAGDAFSSYDFSLRANPEDKISAYLNTIAAVGANTEHSELITAIIKESSRAIGNLKEETVSNLLKDIPYGDVIGAVLPEIFAAIADTPDEEIPQTFATFFGAPPVEPARTKELREKTEKEAFSEEIGLNETDEPIEPDVTDTPETKASSPQKPTTQKPQTSKPAQSTSKPVTKDPSQTSAKPTTTKNTETAKSPETTKKSETTKAAETTKAPEQPKEPTVGGNSGLLGALLGGGSVSDKTDDLTKNKALFDSIRNGAFKAISTKLDVTSEEYSWMYILIQKELSNVLQAVKENPTMTYKEKVDFFAASITQNMNEIIPPEAYKEFGLEFILKPSSMEVIAIFTLDEFTIEKYPSCKVPIKDIMTFMGISQKDIPDWAKTYN